MHRTAYPNEFRLLLVRRGSAVVDCIRQFLVLGHWNWIIGGVLRYRGTHGRTESVRFGDEEKADPGKGLEDALEPVKGLGRFVAEVYICEVGGGCGDVKSGPEEHGEHKSCYPADKILWTG